LINGLKFLIPLVIMVITLNSVFANGEAYGDRVVYERMYSYTSRITGEYIGTVEISVSGVFKSMMENSDDYEPGYLKITYVFNFALLMFIDENIQRYIYLYTLKNYDIVEDGFKPVFIDKLNSILSSRLNKTIVRISSIVNPDIVLMHSLSNGFSFEDFTNFHNVTGIVLYEDVISFNLLAYSEYTYNSRNYKLMVSAYYDSITYTPLYFNYQYTIRDLSDDRNYYFVEITVRSIEIGYQLSREMNTYTYTLYFDNGDIGKIGVVSRGRIMKPVVNFVNETLKIVVNSTQPYRLILVLDRGINVTSDYNFIAMYDLASTVIYMSKIHVSNQTFILKFKNNIIRVNGKNDNARYIHDLTIDGRTYNSIQMQIFSQIINLILILLVYRLSKYISSVLRNVF